MEIFPFLLSTAFSIVTHRTMKKKNIQAKSPTRKRTKKRRKSPRKRTNRKSQTRRRNSRRKPLLSHRSTASKKSRWAILARIAMCLTRIRKVPTGSSAILGRGHRRRWTKAAPVAWSESWPRCRSTWVWAATATVRRRTATARIRRRPSEPRATVDRHRLPVLLITKSTWTLISFGRTKILPLEQIFFPWIFFPWIFFLFIVNFLTWHVLNSRKKF